MGEFLPHGSCLCILFSFLFFYIPLFGVAFGGFWFYLFYVNLFLLQHVARCFFGSSYLWPWMFPSFFSEGWREKVLWWLPLRQLG